jgi:LmbE family N-acetylglucosaminyl deacetylase
VSSAIPANACQGLRKLFGQTYDSSSLARSTGLAASGVAGACSDHPFASLLASQPSTSAKAATIPRSPASKPVPAPVANSISVVSKPQTAASVTTLSVQQQLQPLATHADCSKGTTLDVIAHQDDDLLFMNPDLANAIRDGRCIRTVYLTAGDSGQTTEYWNNRETGAKAAYAAMYNLPNNWNDSHQVVAGKTVDIASLSGAPTVALAFLRLPDGNLRGEGFAGTQTQSLEGLLTGNLPAIQAIDGSAQYTKDQLVAALAAFMSVDQPDQIHTQGLPATADGDHSDHLATGTFTKLAAQAYGAKAVLTQYGGYPDKLLLPNLTSADISLKQSIFFVYGQHDTAVCQTAEACAQTETYGNYLTRQYKEDVPGATP